MKLNTTFASLFKKTFFKRLSEKLRNEVEKWKNVSIKKVEKKFGD